MKTTVVWIITFAFCVVTLSAQKAERKNVREGNKLYNDEKYTESEIAYRKSLEVNPRSIEGTFNLGDVLYKQEKYPEATEQYQLIAGQGEKLLQDNPDNAGRLAHVYHNIGNIGMKNKEYAKSVEAYKQSLRLNPRDDETRYNLALAQKLLEDQQNEDQSQDQQNQEEEQQQNQNEEQQQQQPQQNDQQENKTQEEQQQNEQMSQDNAQQILNAFLQDEKDTQEKVKKAQAEQQQHRRTDKEW
ncbi:MAG: tetratricopeptide repeat protein [Tannerellaceae bacterium]|jgi:tetratricopeptide (TPR) repeat protein|nr:tetratricopeptide repeat protein [Tannerellaceae bacterium]